MNKKLSRRDAIKLLGAATGATLLANLPSNWSKPELVSGVLPAHAQTSSLGLTILNCDFTFDIISGDWHSDIFVGPTPLPQPMIMQYTITFINTHLSSGSEPQSPYVSNTSVSQGSGIGGNADSAVLGQVIPNSGQTSGSVTILWEFTSPFFGSGTCSQTANWSIP